MATASPVLHCVHVIPGEVPSVVITGRHLWVGTEWGEAGNHSISVNGVKGNSDRMLSASGMGPNRGLSVVQRAMFPLGLQPTSNATLSFTRNDGQKDEIEFAIPQLAPRREWIDSGSMVSVSEPVVVEAGRTLDLGGRILVPDKGFRGRAVIHFGRGSVVQNGRVWIGEGVSPEVRAAMAPIQDTLPVPAALGLRCQAMELIDSRPRGMGIFLSSSGDGFISNCSIVAHECVKQDPNDTQVGNIYWRNRFSSPAGVFDGQVGSIGGGSNLVAYNRWHDIDRGPTVSCWGQSLSRTTWFRNVQERTGRTRGASEGLLYESALAWQGQASVTGQIVRVPIVVGPWPIKRLKVGYVVMAEPNLWAKITRIFWDGTVWCCEVDRSLGEGSKWVGMGNACVENNFVENRFVDGKAGVWIFGAQAENYFGGNHFIRLRGGIVSWDRKLPNEWSYQQPYTMRENRFFEVEEREVTIPDGGSWPPEF